MLRTSVSVVVLALAAATGNADSLETVQHPGGYWQYASPRTPASYEPDHGDFIAEFASPSGKQVRLVVKAPVTTRTYEVPPIEKGQSAYDYLNAALYDAAGNPRTATTIKFPKSTYTVEFPLNSSCGLNYVHWQLPEGASDLVIDGQQGSTVNFSDFCLGLNLPAVNRVTFKNFTFSWPNLQIATVAKIVAVGGNGNTGYTYDVHIDAEHTGRLPRILAAINAWDRVGGHWNTADTRNVSYGNGFPAGSGVALDCEESLPQQRLSGCTARGITSYGVLFTVGQSVLLRHYDYATAISASGNDITFDAIRLQNLIGTGFSYSDGRGLRIAHCALARMAGQPISAGGNGSLLVPAVSGDIVFDDDSFSDSGDDPFDLNSPLIRFTSIPVLNNTNLSNNVSTPMNTFTIDASTPADQLQWPAAFGVQRGDTIGLFNNGIGFAGVAKVVSVSTPVNGNTSTVTIDPPVGTDLRKAGFIAADLTSSAGARYLIRDSRFLYTSGRALLLQTPYGRVTHNYFRGQTQKEVYVLASQYWGEGPGAQELIIDHNRFDAGGPHPAGFYALDVMAESTNFFSGAFPNAQNETAGMGSAAPAVNQNLIIADNVFTSDRAAPIVNVSSVSHMVFSGNRFLVRSGSGAYPVTIHDASDIVFDATNRYSSWLSAASCADSPLFTLSSPSPPVAVVLPNACGVPDTVSGLIDEAPPIL